MSEADRTTALIAMIMTGVLLLGMIRRERSGIGGIGFESTGVLLLYAFSVVMLFV
jgi:cation:H+ antiporter